MQFTPWPALPIFTSTRINMTLVIGRIVLLYSLHQLPIQGCCLSARTWGWAYILTRLLPYMLLQCLPLRVLRSHGLPLQSLYEVAKMTTVSSLMYVSPTWWGFTSAGDRKGIGTFLDRMKRQDCLPPQSPDADQTTDRTDQRLFSAVMSNKNHVLHSRLPVKRPRIYDLRPRAHDYSLPPKDEQNFITRLLYLYKNTNR